MRSRRSAVLTVSLPKLRSRALPAFRVAHRHSRRCRNTGSSSSNSSSGSSTGGAKAAAGKAGAPTQSAAEQGRASTDSKGLRAARDGGKKEEEGEEGEGEGSDDLVDFSDYDTADNSDYDMAQDEDLPATAQGGQGSPKPARS